MPDDRPDPDALLAQVQRDEASSHRGRLKIFLGMAPGVGKTYAMLLAAQTKFEAGEDVVVGLVETHGRIETSALLSGLPFIPRRHEKHRGTQLEEFDLDATLARRPKLALVDELAHTNAPGSRHPKRYHDVIELLDAGIDVFSTLNVQHLESRADAVREITGAPVQETVPDSILDASDEVELIDLAPEQLRERLAAGRVYPGGGRANAALENFFREGNLTALREIALRATADRVQRDLREVMTAESVTAPWRTRERLLVAVGPAPSSERLIRYTRRIASNLDAAWTAVFVDGPAPLAETDKARLAMHLDLARRLGGDVVTTAGDDLVEAILRTAQSVGATQIVIGKPPVAGLGAWLRGPTLVDRLIRASGPIDISVVRAEREDQKGASAAIQRTPLAWQPYLLVLGIVAATTILGLLVRDFTGYRSVALLYLIMMMLVGLAVSRGPVLLAGVLGALLWDFVFVPPQYTFYVSEIGDQLMLVTFFVLALVLGGLTSRLRSRERAERAREERSNALYQLTRALNAAPDVSSALQNAGGQIGRLFRGTVAFFLTDAEGRLGSEPHPAGDPAVLTAKDFGVARWSFEYGRSAGRFTDTLPDSSAIFLPMRTSRGAVGVMAVRPRENRPLLLNERELLDTSATQIAIVIERDRLLQSARKAELDEESGRMQRALFDSVSHELKTPLAVITTASEHLLSPLVTPQPATRMQLLSEIRMASRRLERTVNNLLDASRLESGRFELRLEFSDIRELLETAARTVEEQVSGTRIVLECPDGIPPCRIDFGLLETALQNLLFNAASHSPDNEVVRLSVALSGGMLRLSVSDRGPGLPAGAERDRLFEKFERGEGARAGGLGLGLSIVRRLAEAHGGTVVARDGAGGGAEFELAIPVETGSPPL